MFQNKTRQAHIINRVELNLNLFQTRKVKSVTVSEPSQYLNVIKIPLKLFQNSGRILILMLNSVLNMNSVLLRF